MAPVAKLLGMKIVVTYHSKNYEHKKWNWFGKSALHVGELCSILFGDEIIAVSRSLAIDLKRRFPRAANKIHFIPNGADHLLRTTPELCDAPDILSRYDLVKGRYIVTVGRLVPEKGFHDLIQAFKATGVGYKLVIVGDAEHRDSYSSGLLAEASDSIVFTGILTGDALQRILQGASLFVLPSYNEGLPIAALEAAVAGTPVLLSDIQPNRDLGLRPENYFRVGDVGHLRHRLTQDHAIYKVARDAVLHDYNWGDVCAQTDKVYSSVHF
jgi:glycosyltransferase involved in cell wall biosynthesis